MTRPHGAGGWQFRPDIEGLRAVAIVGVVLFHAGIRQVSGGFFGVDVFFVLSGFLISGILVAEVQRTGTIALGEFWARRARRLLPAATLVSLVTLVASAWLDSPFTQDSHAKSAAAFATYWSNILFARRGADYFDQTVATDPFLHTWSLGVEEQYYLLFAPLCLLLALPAWRGGRDGFRRRLLIAAIAVTVTSFVGALVLTAWKPIISFYGLPSRAWEFGVGALLALSASRAGRRAERWWGPVALVGIAMLIASWFLATERTPHPSWITLIPVLGTAALIETGMPNAPTMVARCLEVPFLRWLGRLSYSWYLWHWPLTIYWDRLVPDGRVPMVIGMPLGSLLLAQLTYGLVESPARTVRWLQTARRGLVAAFVLAVVTVAAGMVSQQESQLRRRDPRFAYIIDARDTPTRLHRDGCHLTVDEVEPKFGTCVYGDANADTTVVLLGDSHAAQWFAALEPVVRRHHWRLVPFTKSGCPAEAVEIWLRSVGREYSECEQWRHVVLDSLAGVHPSLIVMTSSDWYEAKSAEPKRPLTATESLFETPPPALWRDGLQQTLDRLPQSSLILLLADTPNPHFNVPACLFEHVRNVGRCAFGREQAIATDLRRTSQLVAGRDARVRYLDLSEAICDGPTCPAVRDGIAMFADGDHLSVRYAATLSSLLAPVVDSLLSRH